MGENFWNYSARHRKRLIQQELGDELEEVQTKKQKQDNTEDDEYEVEKLDEDDDDDEVADSDVDEATAEKLYTLTAELKGFSVKYLEVKSTTTLLAILRRYGLRVPEDHASLNEFDQLDADEPATLFVDGEIEGATKTTKIESCDCQSKVLTVLATMDAKLDNLRQDARISRKATESLVTTRLNDEPPPCLPYSFPLDQSEFIKLQSFIHISKDNFESVCGKVQHIKNRNFSAKRDFDDNFRKFMRSIFYDRFFITYWCGNHKDKEKLQETSFFKNVLTSALLRDVGDLTHMMKRYQNDVMRRIWRSRKKDPSAELVTEVE